METVEPSDMPDGVALAPGLEEETVALRSLGLAVLDAPDGIVTETPRLAVSPRDSVPDAVDDAVVSDP